MLAFGADLTITNAYTTKLRRTKSEITSTFITGKFSARAFTEVYITT